MACRSMHQLTARLHVRFCCCSFCYLLLLLLLLWLCRVPQARLYGAKSCNFTWTFTVTVKWHGRRLQH
jgi:hypothetical protein